MNKFQEILYYIFVPQCAQWHDKDVMLEDKVMIPKKYAFDFGLMIDLMFYGYIIIAMTSWFFPYITLHIIWYVIMVSAFFIGAVFLPILFSLLKEKFK